MACTKNSWKLIWKEPKELKALLLHEIVRASLFLLTEVAEIANAQENDKDWCFTS